ncbi:hypothetical protein A2947_02015 [Candidatus Peribacteria bacterium RIFCSPLOWO2_01_FULL_54_110]|nr:MAG: hypothetical protein A2789_03895 [Candidatus Peribacteria bacterium RIFCSPHIGHO2_01_FULL_54_22]OGJ62366.1 MAG: hypothetical protein A3D12_01940 [Candidatus Peribacteria bacterium RIFCSPHIGHO2_02_FULL_55_24]OGJ68511.1 MAG: hypothetical protein A2947_02015 [Candidatus Peribacteria bacterium RIFCSPLOWO2_01_FULL_54_110]
MFTYALLAAASLSLLVTRGGEVQTLSPPIDALSVTLPNSSATAEVRGWDGTAWTAWFPLAVEEEFDPLLRESNLVIFPRPVSRIVFRGGKALAFHPIRVAKDPVHTLVASRFPLPARRILSREEWGADYTFLFAGEKTRRSDVAPERAIDTIENGNGILPERLRECEEWQRQYPGEFRSSHTVRSDANWQAYRWPLQYSKSVKLLVVHHTAQNVTGDERPPLERVRALYAYHANNRGWGDIGYHYLIDERGQIYEGRTGGKGVIGGHAYCWNTGTMSIALLGNFDGEQPPQVQMQSLQWLLSDLAQTYDIDLGSSVRIHGKSFPAIVGHKDLLSTDCPGYYVRETLAQVREHVWKGDLLATIRFPAILTARRADTPRSRSSPLVPTSSAPLLTPTGVTQLQGRPGMVLPLSMQYRGGQAPMPQLARIADVEADQGIFLWQERGKRFVPVRNSLQLPKKLGARATVQLRLNVQFPMKSGEYRLQIGPVRYTLLATGKRATMKQQQAVPLPQMSKTPLHSPHHESRPRGEVAPLLRPPPWGEVAPHPPPDPNGIVRAGNPLPTGEGNSIRIRLTFSDDTAVVLVPEGTTVNGNDIDVREVLLAERDGQCAAQARGKSIATGVVRLLSAGPVAFASKDGALRRYSGTLECRVLDSALVLINELPLEDYLLGLAEEPDTEPHEKQKAFAIAARSYAAHYMDDGNRPGSTSLGTTTGYKKFPGMPYDGSDDPAVFQAYEGLTFAEKNPDWVRAVRETAGKVLTKNEDILRAAYFSSDDGRTRSPAEAGWTDFPHAEAFGSKPDPWCRGLPNAGHGVGMSGCGARGQAEEWKSAEEILRYYYPGTVIQERGTGN